MNYVYYENVSFSVVYLPAIFSLKEVKNTHVECSNLFPLIYKSAKMNTTLIQIWTLYLRGKKTKKLIKNILDTQIPKTYSKDDTILKAWFSVCE